MPSEEEYELTPLTLQEELAVVANWLEFEGHQHQNIIQILTRRREASPESASRPPAQQGQARAPQKRQKRAPQIPLSQKLFLTPQEAADRLGISRAKLYPKLTGEDFHPWVTDGLWSIKDGGLRFIPVAAFEQYSRKRSGGDETTQR